MSSLSQVIRRAEQVRPQGVATRMGGREQTWSQLADRVARLGGALRKLGVAAGDRVAILALNSDRYYEFYFGVAWSGGVFVPVNTRLAPAEIVHWLNDSESSVLMIDDNFLGALAEIEGELATVRERIYLGDGPAPDGFSGYEDLIASSSAGRGLETGW